MKSHLVGPRTVMRYALRPVLDTSIRDLDMLRVENYLRAVQWLAEVPDLDDVDAWERMLLNLDILVESQGRAVPTVAGLLLFGHSPNRRLPQAGITATAFKGTEKDYDTEDEELIRGPLVLALSDSCGLAPLLPCGPAPLLLRRR